jgi:membrane protease subunit HflC
MIAPARPRGPAGWLAAYPLTCALAAVVLALAGAAVSVVGGDETGVVTRLGHPVRLAAGPDLHWPVLEQVVRIDRRPQPLALDPVAITTAGGERIEVEALVRLRVTDPTRLVATTGSVEGARQAWRRAFSAELARQLSGQALDRVLGADGAGLAAPLAAALDARIANSGARVEGVTLGRVTLAAGPALDAALARMQGRLGDEAMLVRERGQDAARLRQADAEARAAQIANRAYGQDPEFFDFWRAMQSYNAVLGGPADKGGTTIQLGSDSEYLRQFRGAGAGAGRP